MWNAHVHVHVSCGMCMCIIRVLCEGRRHIRSEGAPWPAWARGTHMPHATAGAQLG